MYCMQCGQQLPDGAKYCCHCGSEISVVKKTTQNAHHTAFEAELRKCPNCGNNINTFGGCCQYCGFELLGKTASFAVAELSRQLNEANALYTPEAKPSKFPWERKATESIEQVTNHRIDIIKTFGVPNTKEDTFEFIIMAASNVEAELYSKVEYAMGEKDGRRFKERKAITDAWLSKMEQVYQKAKLLYGDLSDFIHIKKIYDDCCMNVAKQKRKGKKKTIWYCVGMALPLLFWIIIIIILD